MAAVRILVAIYSDVEAWNIPAAQVERLRSEFPDVEFVHAPDEAAALRLIPGSEAAYASQVRPAMLAAAPGLRWIHSPAAGVGSMLFPEMIASPVVVTNSRGLHADAIAEHVLGVTIVLFRKLHVALRRQQERRWAQDEIGADPPLRTLRGSTMGLVGLGTIGSAVARLAAGAGMRVLGLRRRPDRPLPAGVATLLPPGGLHSLLVASDVVVLAAPLTRETRGLIGAPELARMKRHAVLVNIARGKLVRQAELVEALRAGTIGGAALDVFEHEPLEAESPLWGFEQVIVTPHTSGERPDYFAAATAIFIENLRRFLRRAPLLNVVDKRAGY
jgi:phosphoglycerate dehydrogenase-like enzyme